MKCKNNHPTKESSSKSKKKKEKLVKETLKGVVSKAALGFSVESLYDKRSTGFSDLSDLAHTGKLEVSSWFKGNIIQQAKMGG